MSAPPPAASAAFASARAQLSRGRARDLVVSQRELSLLGASAASASLAAAVLLALRASAGESEENKAIRGAFEALYGCLAEGDAAAGAAAAASASAALPVAGGAGTVANPVGRWAALQLAAFAAAGSCAGRPPAAAVLAVLLADLAPAVAALAPPPAAAPSSRAARDAAVARLSLAPLTSALALLAEARAGSSCAGSSNGIAAEQEASRRTKARANPQLAEACCLTLLLCRLNGTKPRAVEKLCKSGKMYHLDVASSRNRLWRVEMCALCAHGEVWIRRRLSLWPARARGVAVLRLLPPLL